MNLHPESDGFSEIARLGDLSLYTCQQLLDSIKLMHVRIEDLGNTLLVTWENDQVLVSICYDPQGNFLYIVREVWKNHGLDVNHHTED